MSWFSPAELPHNKYFIFGKGGGQRLAQEYNIPLLGEVPIVQGICEAGDSGHQQSVEVDSLMRPIFDNLAARVRDAIIERNLSMPRTKKVEITY
jgi:ATP-binding protein involved in chromosome partitioning